MNKILCIVLIIFVSCSVDKTDIKYGEEVCSHCHMVIMDGRYGAELVTNKGKAYKFDAMECLINYKLSNPEVAQDLNSEWTNIYTDKNNLYNASNCVYLRSPELSSPMGAYLNAFEDQKSAEEYRDKHGGVIYSWSQLDNQFKSLPVLNQEN
jgi:copper chaperone NosL